VSEIFIACVIILHPVWDLDGIPISPGVVDIGEEISDYGEFSEISLWLRVPSEVSVDFGEDQIAHKTEGDECQGEEANDEEDSAEEDGSDSQERSFNAKKPDECHEQGYRSKGKENDNWHGAGNHKSEDGHRHHGILRSILFARLPEGVHRWRDTER